MSIIQKIKASEFKRNVLTLLTGTTIAQIIPIAVSPVLTRLYSPEDFGAFALFTSVVTIFGLISSGLYESAIMLPKKEKDAQNIVGLCHIIVISFCFLLFPVAWLFKNSLSIYIQDKYLAQWIYWIPFAALLMGLNQIYTNWSIRQRKFKRLASNRVIQNTALASTNVTAGLYGFGVGGLIIGLLGSQLISNILLFIKIKAKDAFEIKKLKWSRMSFNAKRYQNFPKINLFQVLIDTMQASLIVFTIKGSWGMESLGFYAFMMRILRAPLNLVGTAISQVFFQKASSVHNEQEDLRDLLIKAMKSLALLGIVPFGLLMFFSPQLFSLVFGEEWKEAGTYAQILAPWLYFNFVFSPLSQVPLILNKQKQSFFIGLGYNLIIFGILYLMGNNGFTITSSFYTLSVSISLYLVFSLIWLFNITKGRSYS